MTNTIVELIAKIEHKLRPALIKLPPQVSLRIFASGRKSFVSLLSNDKPIERIKINPDYRVKLWDIDFNVPLFNAAGLFKKGEGYYNCAAQGAGAYLAGTTTDAVRTGNMKNGIKHPVASFPHSAMAVNWMGLPNEGHDIVAARLARLDKQSFCPIGASLSINPSDNSVVALENLCAGLHIYEKAGVDFIELNESCPNVEHSHSVDTINGLDKSLVQRLEYLSSCFIQKRLKLTPVIVKFSNDTSPEQVPNLIELLVTLGYDGINFGNTSTDYSSMRQYLSDKDRLLFEYFVTSFGGGVSGKSLATRSYALSSLAVKIAETLSPRNEFHVIRTGGIMNNEDVQNSLDAGVSVTEWYTGYFENFAKYGYRVYEKLFA